MAVEQRAATAELADLLARFRREAEAAGDRAAWEALRVEWVGRKRGVVRSLEAQAQGDRPRRASRVRQGRPRAAPRGRERRSRRSTAGSREQRARGGARERRGRRHPARAPPSDRHAPSDHAGLPGDREHLPVDGLQHRRRPRDRDRLLQLRRAQLPRRSSGARRAGHPPPARRTAAAHAHLADPDPHAARAQAAGARARLRPRLPQRQHAAALADVPPGRGAGDRPRHHVRPSQGRDRDVLPQAVLGRHPGAAAPELLPVHRAVGRGRHHLPVLPPAQEDARSAAPARAPGGWRSWARAWSIRACSRTSASIPTMWSGFAFGGGIDRVAMARYGLPNIRLLFENDLRLLRQIHR